MSTKQYQTVACQICQTHKAASEMMPASLVRESVIEAIRRKHPQWTSDGFICLRDLNRFRAEYVQDLLRRERGELSEMEESVITSLHAEETLAKNLNIHFERRRTLGDRLADRIADFGGSWRFILIFAGVILVWIGCNSIAFLWRAFDPYPFILLNLLLSCLAAVQAPIIMMSQNRQEAKDRLRAEHDYQVNLKAELEIRHLNAKVDRLLAHQWQHLIEIQQIQMDMMEEMVRGRKEK